MTGKKEISLPLSASLIAVFTVANGLICAPFSGGGLWGFICALALGAIILPLILKVSKKAHFDRGGFPGKAVLVILALLSFLPAVSAFEYCEFVYKAVLPHSDMWLIVAFFTACVLYLSLSRDLVICKFAFLSALFIAAAVCLLFLMSAKTFDLENLSAAFDTSRFSFVEAGEYAVTLVLPAAVAVLYLRLTAKEIRVSAAMWGAAAGAVFSIIVVFDSVLSFSLPFAAKLDYPYIDDISTVTVGSLFTRMDALAYFIFFAAYVLKCAVCVKTSARLISRSCQL